MLSRFDFCASVCFDAAWQLEFLFQAARAVSNVVELSAWLTEFLEIASRIEQPYEKYFSLHTFIVSFMSHSCTHTHIRRMLNATALD